MSSLGDLLLAHAKSNQNENVSDDEDTNNELETDKETSQEVTQTSFSPSSHKVFPERVVKNVKIEQDSQSNASSTDDYVRELLDPSDRPRNVWHVVEGPKQVEGQDEQDDYGPMEPEAVSSSRNASPNAAARSPENSRNDNLRSDKRVDSGSRERDIELDKRSDLDDGKSDARDKRRDRGRDEDRESKESKSDKHRSHRDRDRSREGSSSSRRHRRRDPDHNERDREKERSKDREERDRDRRSHRSRRRDHSDDDDDRHHGSHRYSRGRRSRSRSRTPSRRLGGSRSNSPSPITKRNSRTILIMQLNPRVTSRDLEDFFSSIGRVKEVRLIMDSKTRRHKGIAYIEFENANSATKAFALNGQEFFGAPVVIQSALMDRSRLTGDWHSSTSQSVTHTSSHSSSRSNLPPNSYRIYVGGLHVNLTEEMIRSVFEPFGTIIRLELMKDRVTNISRGYAFITYANIEDGQLAVQSLDGLELAGKALRVSKSTDKSERNTGTDSNYGRAGGRHDDDADSRSSRSRDVTASLYELAGH